MFFNKKLKLQIIFGLNENNEFEMKHNLETQGQYILMALSYYVKVAWIFADGDKYAFEEMIRLTNEVDEDSIISLKSLELVEDFKTTLIYDLKNPIVSLWSIHIPDLFIMNSVLRLIEYVYQTVSDKYKPCILRILKEMNMELEGISGNIDELINLNAELKVKFAYIIGTVK